MSDTIIAIVTLLCIFGLSPAIHAWSKRSQGLSTADRQVIDGLQATAQRLEARVATLERALLDAESAYSHETKV